MQISSRSIDKLDGKLLEEWFSNDSTGKQHLDSYSNPAKWFQLLEKPSRYGYIVMDDEKEIGFIDLELLDAETGAFSIYIAPRFRGLGMCKEVLSELVEIAKSLRLKRITAGVTPQNIHSMKCLQKYGFETINHEDGIINLSYSIQ